MSSWSYWNTQILTVVLGNRNFRLRRCCKPWCEAWWIIPDRAWLIRSKGNIVSQRQALTLFRCDVADHLIVVILLCEKMCALVWLWWLKGVASTYKLGRRRSRNGKLGRAAGYKFVLKKQENNCPYKCQMGWLLGFAINGQQLVQPTLRKREAIVKRLQW